MPQAMRQALQGMRGQATEAPEQGITDSPSREARTQPPAQEVPQNAAGKASGELPSSEAAGKDTETVARRPASLWTPEEKSSFMDCFKVVLQPELKFLT